MDRKTYLLSFLMMDIYSSSVLKGAPDIAVVGELERALDFVKMADAAMQRRGWGEPVPAVRVPRKPKTVAALIPGEPVFSGR